MAAILGFKGMAWKIGAATVAGVGGYSTLATDGQKSRLAGRCVSFYRACDVGSEVSDCRIRTILWDTFNGCANVVAASPAFYFSYHLIHRSGLPLSKHVFVAAARGVSGTLASIPALILFYGAGAVIMPKIEQVYIRNGYSTQTASMFAQGSVFLGMGSPVEYGVEFAGCGLNYQQLQVGPSILGTMMITGRLATGVLYQFRIQENVRRGSSSSVVQDFLITTGGTTLFQHVINATLKAQEAGRGLPGVWNYVRTGSALGLGTSLTGIMQFGGSLFQRILFVAIWNQLSHREVKTPNWVTKHDG